MDKQETDALVALIEAGYSVSKTQNGFHAEELGGSSVDESTPLELFEMVFGYDIDVAAGAMKGLEKQFNTSQKFLSAGRKRLFVLKNVYEAVLGRSFDDDSSE